MVVFGTRPEAIKMCPLVKELNKADEFGVIVCVTGQHREMLQQVLEAFDVEPDYNLDIMQCNQTLGDITGKVLSGMQDIFNIEKPDLVLVHGDTSTAYATALASFYCQIPIGHVEAGLRTYDLYSPYPEEFNRQSIGIMADFHFAPTETARKQLLKEGKNPERVYVTGNTVIDALKTTIQDDFSHNVLEWAEDAHLVLLPAHRREKIGEPLYNIFVGIKRVLDENVDVKIVYPIHKNPKVREIANKVFGNNSRVKIIEPLDVIEFHNIMNRACIIMTDSGGIQEEAPSLGKPVLVLRDTTERPEGVEAGTLRLVGTNADNVYKEFSRLLTDKNEYQKMSRAVNPYGDGTACEKIVEIIKKNIVLEVL